MSILVYFDGGDKCLGCCQREKDEIEGLKAHAKRLGHIGYLYGHRTRDSQTDRVYVFFKERPTVAEIQERRRNGFAGATWFDFPHVGK